MFGDLFLLERGMSSVSADVMATAITSADGTCYANCAPSTTGP